MSHVKVLFEVDSSAGGTDLESMWAVPVESGYQIDNIPFYANGVANRDVVSAFRDDDGMLRYSGLVLASGHSTVRLWFATETDVGRIREALRTLGCSSEADSPRLLAVDIPPSVPYEKVRAFLEGLESAGVLEFEEACIGQ